MNRSYYLEEAIEDQNSGAINIFDLYMQAQYKEREEIFYSVLNSIDELIEAEADNEETE